MDFTESANILIMGYPHIRFCLVGLRHKFDEEGELIA